MDLTEERITRQSRWGKAAVFAASVLLLASLFFLSYISSNATPGVGIAQISGTPTVWKYFPIIYKNYQITLTNTATTTGTLPTPYVNRYAHTHCYRSDPDGVADGYWTNAHANAHNHSNCHKYCHRNNNTVSNGGHIRFPKRSARLRLPNLHDYSDQSWPGTRCEFLAHGCIPRLPGRPNCYHG
jgi:hypothetical protein